MIEEEADHQVRPLADIQVGYRPCNLSSGFVSANFLKKEAGMQDRSGIQGHLVVLKDNGGFEKC